MSRSTSLEDIIAGKLTYSSTCALKNRLVKEGLLEYKCSWCGIFEWRNQKLSLQLDHIDGNRLNNKLDNLRLLCPNCHTQTDTYAGKNARKSETMKRKTKRSSSKPAKPKEKKRYKCSHCDYLSTRKGFKTCRACQIRLGLWGHGKLTNEDRKDIIDQFSRGVITRTLATQYKVAQGTIQRIVQPYRQDLSSEEGFWLKARGLATENECWTWPATMKDGSCSYVRLPTSESSKASLPAYRVAYKLAHNLPSNASVMVVQTCGNKCCCNPKHLSSVKRKQDD